MNRYKVLAANTMWIAIGSLGSKLIMFFMVRFYTGCLSPSEFGTAELITQTVALILPVVTFGITEGVFRFTVETPGDGNRIFSIGFFAISAGTAIFFFAAPALGLIGIFKDYVWLIAVYVAMAGYHSLCSQFVRACGKTSLYALQGILNTAVMISGSIFFMAVCGMGIKGYVLAVVTADFLVTAGLVLKEKLWKQLTREIKLSTVGEVLKYSIPLIPTAVFWWITSVSDRYMITYFLGSEANGLYAVAYKIPTILALVSGAFMEAWHYSAMVEAQKSEQIEKHFFSRVLNSYITVLAIVCSAIIGTSRLGVQLLAVDSYYEAWKYIPVLALATVFSSLGSFLGSVFLVIKRSDISFWTVMFGALTNIGLNIVLLQSPLGVQGAAIATLASYLVVLAVRTKVAGAYLNLRSCAGLAGLNLMCICAQVYMALAGFGHWYLQQFICFAAVMTVNFKVIKEGFCKSACIILKNRCKEE